MAAHKQNTDLSNLTEEQEELLDFSQDASQNLLEGDEDQVFNVEHTLNRLHSNIDLFDELVTQSEDENASEISESPKNLSQESPQKKVQETFY